MARDAQREAEEAAVRAALAQGYLDRAQLREALLLREELAGQGRPVGLLQLLRIRFLPEACLPELSRVYHLALTRGRASEGQRAAEPGRTGWGPPTRPFPGHAGHDEQPTLRDPPSAAPATWADRPTDAAPAPADAAIPPTIPPEAVQRSRDQARLPEVEDPTAVREFLARSGDSSRVATRAHAGRPPSAESRLPRAIGRYQVLERVGRGGMGVVFRALDPELEREVAVKVLPPLDAGPEEVERFRREARAVARLRHPHVVTVFDVGEADGALFLVMDLVRGASLAERVRRDGPVDPWEAARLMEQVARALAHAHERGLLHRDVKPGNVLVDDDGGARVVDFGLTRAIVPEVRDALTVTGQVMGTPAYMAPEQALGQRDRLDPRTDVYGAGATLYYLLTGRAPFAGAGAVQTVSAVLEEPPRPPRALRPDLPAAIERICLTCLAKDPAGRYPTAEALAEDLARFARGQAVAATPPRPAARPAPRWQRGAEAAALLAAAAFGVWAVGRAHALPPLGAVGPLPGTPALSEAAARRGEVGALVSRGRRLAAAGEVEAAARSFTSALELDPRQPSALVGRARLSLAQGDLHAALADVERARELAPGDAPTLLLLGQVLEERGALDDAIEAYAAAEELGADEPTAREASSARRGAERARALELAREAEQGLVRHEAAQALELYQRALALAPDEASLYAGRAWVFLQLEEDERAWRDAERALDLDPAVARAHSVLGVVRSDRGDLEGAYRAFTLDLQRCTPAQRHGVHLNRGFTALTMGHLATALKDFEAAVAIAPDDAEALFARAQTKKGLGDRAGCRADLARVLELDPGFGAAYAERGHLLATAGEPAAAIADYDRALELLPPGSDADVVRRLRAEAQEALAADEP